MKTKKGVSSSIGNDNVKRIFCRISTGRGKGC